MMKKNIIIILIMVLIISLAGYSKNYETILNRNCSFLQMTDFEVSQELIVGKNSEKQGDIGRVPITFNYALLENMEVGIQAEYIFYNKSEDGLGDLNVSQRFKFTKETQSLPSFSGGFSITLPTNTFDFDTTSFAGHKVDFELFFTTSKKFNNINFFGGAGLNFLEGGDDKEFKFGAGINMNISKRFKMVTEYYGVSSDYIDEHYFAPGLIFVSPEKVSIRIGVPIGLNDESYNYKVIIGMKHIF